MKNQVLDGNRSSGGEDGREHGYESNGAIFGGWEKYHIGQFLHLTVSWCDCFPCLFLFLCPCLFLALPRFPDSLPSVFISPCCRVVWCFIIVVWLHTHTIGPRQEYLSFYCLVCSLKVL